MNTPRQLTGVARQDLAKTVPALLTRLLSFLSLRLGGAIETLPNAPICWKQVDTFQSNPRLRRSGMAPYSQRRERLAYRHELDFVDVDVGRPADYPFHGVCDIGRRQ